MTTLGHILTQTNHCQVTATVYGTVRARNDGVRIGKYRRLPTLGVFTELKKTFFSKS